MFIHLEAETAFSFRSATLTPEAIARKAKELGSPAAAVTDWNTMHAAVPFYTACLKQGIKPIIGLKAEIASVQTEKQKYPLLLYAQNQKGLANLIKISSALQTKAKEGLPVRWLEGYAAGLAAVFPGLDGDPSWEAAERFQAMFPHFYLGIRGKEKEQELLLKAKAAGIPLIAIGDVQYENRTGAFAAKCLQAIRENRLIEANEEFMEGNRSFQPLEEIKRAYEHEPEAVQNTLALADLCNVTMDFGRRLIPSFPLPEGVTAEKKLNELCREGLKKTEAVYQKRLDYELSVIGAMQFADYFLIVHDFMQFARSRDILTGPGRGSAAGSLVAYTLGITAVDPIHHGLLFERFLNPERTSMPDIDIDFPDHRREEVIRYIANKYGAVHAAQIVTFGTLSAKAVMRDTARVFGFDAAALSRLSGLIPSVPGMQLNEVDVAKWRQESPVHERIYQTALQLEGLPRHTSTHAAGIIISEQPLTEHVPLMEGQENMYLTQYAMEPLEKMGLLKMDLLGLRNLTTIERVISSIQRTTGQKVDLLALPLEDERVFQLFSKGRTAGIFQFESSGMKNVLTRLQPDRFEDLVAVNALYRPGPMEQIPLYIKRRHGQESVSYAHPVLADLLKPTYGILVYQEQIIQIAVKMAGFTPGQADLLRRAVSKKKKETLEEERSRFMAGAAENGIEVSQAAPVYDLIVRFANYGFNRSHAVAYTMIGYWMAWLKAYYPAHFLAALMQAHAGNEEKVQQYAAEAGQLGIQFLAPSINASHFSFTVKENQIRFGLVPVKGVGQKAAAAIIEARKSGRFTDLFQLCQRTNSTVVTRPALEALIWAGALDEFGQDRAVLLASLDAALEYAALMEPGEDSLLEGLGISFKPKYADVPAAAGDVKLEKEKEVLGQYISAHPLSAYRARLQQAGASTLSALSVSKKAAAGGLVGAVKEIRTKKGEKMAFSSLMDETGERDMILFPESYRKAAALLQKGAILFATGAVEERNGRLQLVVQSLEPVEQGIQRAVESAQKLYIRFPEGKGESERVENVYSQLLNYPGRAYVIVHYERTHETVQLGANYRVAPEKELLARLKTICGAENVVLK